MRLFSKKDVLEEALKISLDHNVTNPEDKLANAARTRALVAIARAMSDNEVTSLILY